MVAVHANTDLLFSKLYLLLLCQLCNMNYKSSGNVLVQNRSNTYYHAHLRQRLDNQRVDLAEFRMLVHMGPTIKRQRERGKWAVNYTSPQSII